MIVPVILSGGSGTRLWPLSRKHHPKQFLNLINNDSTLFQDTVHRLSNNEDTPLEIIEIQTGSYLEEDDIIRLEDDYQRN